MKKKTTHFWVYLFAICCDFYLFRLFNDCLIYKLGSPQKLLYTFQIIYLRCYYDVKPQLDLALEKVTL